MSDYLDQIEERIARSTAGPWETRINDLTDEVTVVHDSEAVLQVAWIDGDYRHTWAMPDAEFIAHAREDGPRMVAALRGVLRQADALDELAASPIGASYAGALRLGARGIRHAITKAVGAES